jgi:hypothetical protein
LILAELSTYAQFGHWMLPLYDYEYFDFCTGIPLSLRYRQPLYIGALLQDLLVNDLSVLTEIPIAYKGRLHPPALDWRDWLLLRKPSFVPNGWILQRAARAKQQEHLESIGTRSSEPSGPDPLDHWWYDYPEFRRSVSNTFLDWDGLHGIIDVSALSEALQKPLPRLFVQFTVPALLTLFYFQRIVERDLESVG